MRESVQGVAIDEQTDRKMVHPQGSRNLGSLIEVSRSIVCAAKARENSRGAHYREDFPEAGEIARSTFTRVRLREATLACDAIPVRFTRVRPGETLL